MTVVNSKKLSFDVLIVGAGPIGITTANLLGAMGIDTLVIDKSPEILQLPRAVGMCDEGSRIVHGLGLMQELEKEMLPVDDVFFMKQDDNPGLRVDTGSIVNGFQVLRTIYQPGAERILRKGLTRYKNVELMLAAELLQYTDLGDRVKSTIKLNADTEQAEYVEVNSRFVLGCDGAGSIVRKMLGVELKGHTYAQDWLVVDVANDPLPEGTPVQFLCDKNRPAVTLPTPNRSRRWEFVLKDGETAEEMCSMETVTKLLKPWGDAAAMDVQRKTVYTFHALTAERFSKGNVFLLGDAAHLTPPFAGQGLMAGFRDANNIAWRMSYVLKGLLPPSILESYSEERRPQAQIIIGMARFLGFIILPQNMLLAALRDAFFVLQKTLTGNRKLQRSTKLKKSANSTLGLKSMLYWFKKPTILMSGFEFPFIQVETPAKEIKTLDTLFQNEYFLLSKDVSLFNYISNSSKQTFMGLGGKLVSLDKDPEDEDNGFVFTDIKQILSKQLIGKKEVALVRPDRFVVFTCTKNNLNKKLQAYFSTLFEKSDKEYLDSEVSKV